MLKGLTRTQATKEELWFTLINTVFIDYLMDYIRTIKGDKNVAQKIKNAIFFNHGNVRSLVVQHLAKYWWIGFRTYDEFNSSNPYWLTDFFTELDPLLVKQLLSLQVSSLTTPILHSESLKR